jgi:hypothetical protein
MTFAVCVESEALCFCSKSARALAASGSFVRALVKAACSACAFSGFSGAASASATASAAAGLVSLPLIQLQMDLPASEAASLAASFPKSRR